MQDITIQIIYFAFIAVSGIISKGRQLQEKNSWIKKSYSIFIIQVFVIW